MNVEQLLKTVSQNRIQGVSYPSELLSRFDPQKSFDRENLGYLTQGGEGGGYFHWLTLAARHAQPRLIVELGNRYGVSTLALYHGLPAACRLVTVDIIKDQRYVPEIVYQDPRVKFVFGDCLDLTSYEANGTQIPLDIDILWTDTVHFYKQLAAEFHVYEPLLADEALLVVDDIRLNDKGRFFKEASFEKFDLTEICHVSGFGVLHYVRSEKEKQRSTQERFYIAMKRAVEIGYRNYWELFTENERLTQTLYKVQLKNLPSRISHKIRKAIRRIESV